MKAAPRIGALLVAAALAATSVCACNIVAGLSQFHPATDSASTTGGGGAGGASATTDTSTSDAGSTVTSGEPASSSSSSGPGCAGHLLLNEVRLHQDFVELYNPTNQPIDLSQIRIWALAGGGSFDKKWDGSSIGPDLAPGGYFLVVEDDGAFTNEDAKFSTGISNSTDPTVIAITDQSNVVIDSVCVCAADNCEQAFGEELCAGRFLLAPGFQTDTGDGASRQGCEDTDKDNVDFAVACPTPKQQNDAIACP